jgi:hypothetical protein
MENEEKIQFATLDNLTDLIIDIWRNMMPFTYDLIEQFGPRLFSPQAPPLPDLGHVSERIAIC